MPNAVQDYFRHIAEIAQNAVAQQAPPPAPCPPVVDTPQESRATCWSALAVHPMSVLESEYVSIVRAAEARAGHDVDAARENGFQALSRFFALTAEVPTLLQPDTPPLVDERGKDLAARFTLARDLSAADRPAAYQELCGVIGDAAEMVAAAISPAELPHAPRGIRQAADYLGLFDVAPADAARRWQQSHPSGSESSCLDEVETALIKPLLAPGEAAASARSLYNIAPFYLYRLMHRFVGGDQAASMDLAAKGIASGAATAALHDPGWDWLTRWHEEQVVALRTRLADLGQRLAATFKRDDEVIRFHLKGGRAMYIALGRAGDGRNDWDTGVLINPQLPPEQWYAAYAAVNDEVVRFLDRARFGYGALLAAHAAELPAAATARASLPPADLQDRDYSRLALLADNLEERHAAGAPAARGAAAAALGDARRRQRPAGVNGELIDIGIAKRSSVELAEHWMHVEIVERPGTGADAIPVPTLPYFVDDFSTIIREALANGTADRKLAKRLRRLKLVLESDDAKLRAAVTAASQHVRASLPKGAVAIGAGEDSAPRALIAWVLDALLRSTPESAARPAWITALDAYLSAHAVELRQAPELEQLWRQVSADIDPADRDICQGLLQAQSVASQLAHRVLADARCLTRALGASEARDLSRALEAIGGLNRPSGEPPLFYLSGSHAARMQTRHARLDAGDVLERCPDAMIEVFYRDAGGHAQQALESLNDRLGRTLANSDWQSSCVRDDQQTVIAVTAPGATSGMTISPARVTVLLVRQEPAGVGSARILDFLAGWPVASTRDLTRLFADRGAHSPDYDLRTSRKQVADFLRTAVLGRQLR